VREDEEKSVASPEPGDRRGQRVVLYAESAAQAWESFALIALTSAGVCDRTLRPNLGRGAVPCPAAQLQSCPAFYCSTSRWCAPFTRGRSIFFGAAPASAATAILP